MKMQKIWVLGFLLAATGALAGAPADFMGRWALDLPNNGAGWMSFNQQKDYVDGGLLWYGGSVNPFDHVYFDGDKVIATRTRSVERGEGNAKRRLLITDYITATVSGDTIKGTLTSPKVEGTGLVTTEFTGKKIPPVPPAPDLSKVKFGDPITLFNGKDLTGWRLTDPNATNGWSVEDGILVNVPKKAPGKSAGNLRTDKEFEDFNLTLEANAAPKQNSGIYLRGIYEVQVEDSYGKPLDSHNMGAVYSRIAPTVSAEKPAGEWQKFDITLVDRHVTVILNGKKIIDNQPLEGCTGGALWSDEFKPGPIYLQGDHTAVKYRNIVLKPVVK